jgi:hypothetical protein
LAEDENAQTGEPSLHDLQEALRQIKVGQFMLSTASTLASLGYGKIEAGELPEAKAAIDAIQALLPVMEGQVEEQMRRDFESALANLKIAYADAVSRAE